LALVKKNQQRAARLVIVLAVALAAGGVASAAPTRAIRYEPFAGAKLAATTHVVNRTPGHCLTSSTSRRRDAWRCFAGNFVYDPCFSAANVSRPTYVVCPIEALNGTVVRLSLTSHLPAPARSAGPPLLWEVQTSNGATCRLTSGALGVLAGKVPHYSCTDRAFLGGYVHQAGHHWWVWRTRTYGRPVWRRAAVARAWY
jgi:hypothetical protein